MPIKTLLGLIICNVIWSGNPAMGKLVLADFHPFHAAVLRYSSALLSYIIAVYAIRQLGPKKFRELRPFFAPSDKRVLGLVILLGAVSSCLGPLFQLSGLSASRATDNSIIIALEPLITVLMARIFIGERLNRLHQVAFGIATLGFCMLARLTPTRIAEGMSPDMWGNLALLISLFGEGSYSVIGRKLVEKNSALSVFGSVLAVGVAMLWIVSFLAPGVPIHFESFTWRSMIGILWLGPLGTTATYLYWMFALTNVTVASISLTLFIQPLLGAVWGYWFLAERLSVMQAAGGVLILAAVFSQALYEINRAR